MIWAVMLYSAGRAMSLKFFFRFSFVLSPMPKESNDKEAKDNTIFLLNPINPIKTHSLLKYYQYQIKNNEKDAYRTKRVNIKNRLMILITHV